MNIQPVLLFCFLSVLQDGNIGLINAQISIYRRTEGESITVPCFFPRSGRRKYFCKGRCDRPLTTRNDRAQRGRFGMRYVRTSIGSRLDVTITQLTKSDSGDYRCGFLRPFSGAPYKQFEIIVTDAFTTTQSFRRSSTSSSSSTNKSEQKQNKTTTDGGSAPNPSKPKLTPRPAPPPTTVTGMILYPAVPVTVVISVTVTVVVLLAVFLPLLYKRKKRSSDDLNSRGHVTDTKTESVVYENCVPVSTLGKSGYENDNPSSTYETLNPATMSPDQTYATIGQKI